MSQTWLIIDASYLAYRAHYSTGGLAYRGLETGVVYGFLRDIVSIQDLFLADRMVFCFDYGFNLRKRDYPGYKGNRVEDENHKKVHEQLKLLRREYLRQAGFRNLLYEKGYEADDIMASVCATLPRDDQAILVSSDQDLYQLLAPRVIYYNPGTGKTITEESFSRMYGVSPIQWVDVKAIAGCQTDCVSGVKGVGPKTAAKFITGRLKPGSKAYEAIVTNNRVWRYNRGIVRLPYPGTPEFELVEDQLSIKKWRKLTKQLGMRSLLETAPVG